MVVTGYRIHASGHGVGSLLVSLYDDDGALRQIGGISAFTQRMLLMEMCSPALRYHFSMREHILPNYAAVRQDISDYLRGDRTRGKGGRLAAAEKRAALARGQRRCHRVLRLRCSLRGRNRALRG